MERLLSPKTLATTLGLAEQTIYNRHSAGGNLPPAIKIGRMLRFRPADVEAWLKQLQVSTTTTVIARPSAARRPGRPTKSEQIAARRTR